MQVNTKKWLKIENPGNKIHAKGLEIVQLVSSGKTMREAWNLVFGEVVPFDDFVADLHFSLREKGTMAKNKC